MYILIEKQLCYPFSQYNFTISHYKGTISRFHTVFDKFESWRRDDILEKNGSIEEEQENKKLVESNWAEQSLFSPFRKPYKHLVVFLDFEEGIKKQLFHLIWLYV